MTAGRTASTPDLNASARWLADLAHRIDARLMYEPGWPALVASICRAEATGYDTDTRLPALAQANGGLPARHPSRELHFRLLSDHPAAAGPPSGQPAGPTERKPITMSESSITIAGQLTRDPQRRPTTSGDLATFTLACTGRYRGPDGQWVDGDTSFVPVQVWGSQAEHVLASLGKGSRALATGRLRQRSYTSESGESHTSLELVADEVAASLRFTSARPIVLARAGGPADSPA